MPYGDAVAILELLTARLPLRVRHRGGLWSPPVVGKRVLTARPRLTEFRATFRRRPRLLEGCRIHPTSSMAGG
jgi:hypothetical protein